MADLPEPLTPATCDLQDFKFMPLDVARLRDSDLASDETPECCWAAVLIWCASWHQVPAASVPDSDQWLAKQAGYVARGKVAKEWLEVREGAMRGWVKCSDGRLYHPVVAEKAIEAWDSKLDQRWRTEVGRIKKHNERHGTAIPRPTFDDWISQGCPQGHRLPVPEDKPPLSPATQPTCPGDVPGETPSKGQEQGQRQGQINTPPTPKGGCKRFEEFWTAWPKGDRKQDKVKCAEKWRRSNLDAVADAILADIEVKRSTDKWREGFVEAPLVYLNGKRWEDGVEAGQQESFV